MKKLTKKLFVSIMTLVLVVMALSTSTFAWFSMNTQVNAEGMQISVKSDSTYLLISNTLVNNAAPTAANIQAENQGKGNITVNLGIAADACSVYPSAHRATGDNVTLAGSDVVEDTESASTVGNWYTRVADFATASASTKAATALSSFTNYVLHETVYLTLAAGSQDATNLVVEQLTIAAKDEATGNSTTISPVKVLITSSSAAVELDNAHTTSDTVLASAITSSTVVQLDIFIYYDGNDSNVFTNNVANLDGATIALRFGVSLPIA